MSRRKHTTNRFYRYQVKSLTTSDCQETISIITACKSIRQAINDIEKFAASDESVLISGETGTGKELWAMAIHQKSCRADRSFVVINCAQFQNEDLLVSELFGHRKGSFTDARWDQKGAFEEAHGSTVFLDEIDELSQNAQALLLRTMETGEIKPLGDSRVRRVDVRIIAATNQNLKKAVTNGKFRKDLYYRLNYLRIHLPPLRERGAEDIRLLAEHFLEELNNRHDTTKRFSAKVMESLIQHLWPGNVRELKGEVTHLYYHSGSRKTILIDDFSIDLLQTGKNEQDSNTASEFYRQMVENGKTFWEVVKEPFMQREIKRSEVREVIKIGLQQAGNYKNLLPLFHLKPHEYKKFVNFLSHHDLRP